MDISTVSRVANSKYVSHSLRYKIDQRSSFSESMKNDQGEDISTKEIKKILENIIIVEDKKKPLTDDKLVAKLKEKGYLIARKNSGQIQREQLDIPVARLRKTIVSQPET